MPAKVSFGILLLIKLKLTLKTRFLELSSRFRSEIENRFRNWGKGKSVKIEKTIRLRWHHIENWICDSDIKATLTTLQSRELHLICLLVDNTFGA